MAKRAEQRKVAEEQTRSGEAIAYGLLNGTLLWQIASAAFGALIALAFLMPVDAISVFAGAALPQNLGWLTLAIIAVVAACTSKPALHLNKFEVICAVAAFAWLLGCTWWLSRTNDGRAVWNSYWQLISLGSCFYIGRALFQFTRVRSATFLIICVGCSALAMDGLHQVFISMPATRREYEADPERVLAENEIQAPPGSPRRKQFEDRLNSPEPFATFALANSLGTLLSCGVILTGGWLVTLNRMRRSRTLADENSGDRRLVIAGFGVAVALLVQLVCLLLTRSRAGYLALLLSLGIWLALELLRKKDYFTLRQSRIGIAVIGTLIVGAMVWLLAFDSRVLSEATKSLGYRVEYWQATLSMIRDHALTGVGLGNFQAYYPQYKLEQASEIIADPHNWILDITATLSIPLAALIVGWVVTTLTIGAWRTISQRKLVDPEPNQTDADATLFARRLMQGALLGSGLEILFLALIGNIELRAVAIEWSIAVAIGIIVWGTLSEQTNPRQQLDLSVCVAALSAIAIAQLVSGSWQASGIAIPFLLLSAMIWSTWLPTEPKSLPLAKDLKELNIARVASRPAVLFALLGATVFGFQAWRPVMQSWMLAVQVSSGATLNQQQDLIAEAAHSDPLNRGYLLQHAMILGAQAEAADDEASFTKRAKIALQKVEEAVSLDAASSVTPKIAGQLCFDLAAAAEHLNLSNSEYLEAAQGFYSIALSRYPSSVELMVQNSVVAAALGDWAAAQATAQKAEELSERIPHIDKQLEAQIVWLPLDLPGLDRTAVASDSGDNWARAEPLNRWIRNHSE